jgi:hypothetical protein
MFTSHLSLDEFQAGILSEDARLAHALELIGGERVFVECR